MEKSLAVPQKSNMFSLYSIPRYIAKTTENICSHKSSTCMFTATFFWMVKKVKTTQMSFNWWVDKQSGVYPYIPTSHKKKSSADTVYNMDKSWKYAERSQTQRNTCCMIPPRNCNILKSVVTYAPLCEFIKENWVAYFVLFLLYELYESYLNKALLKK